MTELRLKGERNNLLEFELKPKIPTEAAIWLLYFLKHDNFVIKYILKRNKQGDVKVKILTNKRSDWPQLVEDTKLTITKEINNTLYITLLETSKL